MIQSIKISVIIVTYDRLHFLKKCLEAIQDQTLSKYTYEVIVVDDGSKDGTKEYLKNLDWQGKPSVKCFFNTHQGYVAARNFGASKAHGTYITFTDDDCIPEPRWLEKVIEAFQMDNSIGVVGSVTRVAFRNKLFLPLNQAFKKKQKDQQTQKVKIFEGETGFIGLKPFSGCNLHICKEIFDELGGFDESIGPAEDLDFLYRYLKKGGKTANHLDLWVDHFERDDLRSMFKRWFTFGKCDTEMVRRYLRSTLSLEVNLFHGFLNYHFVKIPFPVGVYFQLNIFKIFMALIITTLIVPQFGLSLLFLLFGGLFLRQRNPKLTLSFLLYSIYLEASYALGTFFGSFKNRVICI